MFAIVVNK